MVYVIYVTYGGSAESYSNIRKITKEIDIYPIIVDTKLKSIVTPQKKIIKQNLNCFFEFSGYQEGLKALIEDDVFSNDENNIVVFNDTIFKSHVSLLFKYVFNLCINKKYKNSVYGLTENRFFGMIIPSCFFYFQVDKENLTNINFLADFKGCESSKNIKINDLYVSDKLVFQKEVFNWLCPKSLYKGWYKSLPWKMILKAEYERKYIAIYLEYSFLLMNPDLNVVSLNKSDKLIGLLKKTDRIYCNFIKLRYRIIEFYKYKVYSYFKR